MSPAKLKGSEINYPWNFSTIILQGFDNKTENTQEGHKIERKRRRKTKMEKEGDERREAALASTKLLQPNFNPKRLTKHQLSKFQVPFLLLIYYFCTQLESS